MSNKNRARLFLVFFMLVGLVNSTVACEARSGNAAPPLVSQDPAPATPKPEPTPEAKAEKVPCRVPRDQASEIKGLRLGLTTEQVLALFPGSKEDAELKPALAKPPTQFGTSTLMIKPDRYMSTKEKFAGIREIIVNFLDGRVSSFQANYESAPWKHVDEFVTSFTTGSKLPGVDSWDAYTGLDTQQKSLKCDGFEVTLFAGGEALNANHVKVQDLVAAEEVKERRAKAKQKAAAKP